jgi:hypothetical protein
MSNTAIATQIATVQRAQRELVRALVAVQINTPDAVESVLSLVRLASGTHNNTAMFAEEVEAALPDIHNNVSREIARALITELRTLGTMADAQRAQRRSRRV